MQVVEEKVVVNQGQPDRSAQYYDQGPPPAYPPGYSAGAPDPNAPPTYPPTGPPMVGAAMPYGQAVVTQQVITNVQPMMMGGVPQYQ